MKFDLFDCLLILERTPEIITQLTLYVPDELRMKNEGKNTWSLFDIVGHLIHGEKTDWVPRIKIILSDSADKKFEPFDRFAQIKRNKNKDFIGLLDEFEELREKNLDYVNDLDINDDMLNKTGIHPGFGEVTLRQLIATWAVHDLNHIAQIARVIAKQYKEEVGPWVKYLPVLNK